MECHPSSVIKFDLYILYFSNIDVALGNCLGKGTFTYKYSFKMVVLNLSFICMICCDEAIWSPQPGDRVSLFYTLADIPEEDLRVPDCTRNDVLFINCLGTPQ